MKISIFTLSIFAFFGVVSCSEKDDPTSSQDVKVETYMSATTGGETWTATTVTSRKEGDADEYVVFALGEDAEGSKISITFAEGIDKPGKYEYKMQAASEQTAYSAFSDASAKVTYGSYSGTLEVLEHDLTKGVMKGNFEFVGLSAGGKSTAITQGKFQIAY